MSLIVLALSEFAVTPVQRAAWRDALPSARRSADDRSLLGNRLLRLGLLRLGFPASAMAGLRYPDIGKPRLALPIDFSIAHCDGQVLCALSSDEPVGIDIEALGTQSAASFRLYLDDTERRWAGEDPHRFYTLWTRKEAVIKAADGAGLRELAEVRLDPEGDTAELAGARWHTVPLAVGDRFVAHLARRDRTPVPVVERISRETLL